MATYPFPKFSFRVQWNDERIGFTEVSGLDIQNEVIEYREGSSQEYHKIKMPGMQKFSNITLKHGSMKSDYGFFNWINATTLTKAERRDVIISLLDETHQPVMSWKAKECFPVSVKFSDLKSDGNEVAIESLEFAHEGLSMVI